MANDTHKILRNSTFSFAGYVFPMLLSVIVTPIIVLGLGPAKYGAFIFIGTISGFISVLTTGFDGGIMRQVSLYYSEKNSRALENLAATINLLFIVAGLISASVIIGGFLLGTTIIPDPSMFGTGELLILFSLSALNIFIQSFGRLYPTIVSAIERFDISAKIGIGSLTLLNTGLALIAFKGYDLIYLFIWQIIVTTLTTIITMMIATRLVPGVRYRIAFHKEQIPPIFSFSFWAILSEFSRISLISLDKILIPLYGGSIALTYYSVPSNLAARLTTIAGNLSGAVFPTTARLHSGGHSDKMRSLYTRSSRLILILAFAIGTAMILNANNILKYWLSEEFAINSSAIFIIFAAANIIFALHPNITNFLAGMGKIKVVMATTASMALINAALLTVLLPRYGIAGAAWSYAFSSLPLLVLIYLTEIKYLGLEKRTAFYFSLLTKHAATFLIMVVLQTFLLDKIIVNLVTLVIFGPLCVGLYLGVYKLFGFFEKEDSRDLMAFTKRILKK